MKTVIKGKNIENLYSVVPNTKVITDKNGEKITVYTAAPKLNVEVKVASWEPVLTFKGDPRYNSEIKTRQAFCNRFIGELNISENETISICEKIFRADLNELHLFSDKVLSETDTNKADAEEEYKEHLAKFNEMMINSDEKLLGYCKLHKLEPKETDMYELFKLVYKDNKSMNIVDGKVVIGEPCHATYMPSIDHYETYCATSNLCYSAEITRPPKIY